MHPEEAVRLARSLVPPTNRDEIVAFDLEGSSARIGKDTNGLTALVVPGRPPPERLTNLRLSNLQLVPGLTCVVRSRNTEARGRFTVARCMLTDRESTDLFVRVVVAVASELKERSPPEELATIIQRLAALFALAQQTNDLSIQGLWAELLVILDASDIGSAVAGWHLDPSDKYDFSSEDQRIDVKSTSRPSRVHHVDLDQIRPPGQSCAWLISYLVRRQGGGTTPQELVDSIRDRLTGDIDRRLEFDRKLIMATGREISRLGEIAFDLNYSRSKRRTYEASQLPCIALPVPDEVSSVRFQLDLSNTDESPRDRREQADGLIFALEPSG